MIDAMKNNIIEKEVVWAEGRKQSERGKYTSWSSSNDYSFLGGFTISSYGWNDFVGFTAHCSDGKSYGKFFQIPLDRVDEICDALQQVKKFCLSPEVRKDPRNK